ncbi:hypothetical protein ACIGD1_20560 [Streptomyces sp. NPDC085612]|uniref:hypothetical protein n=1 Tax=Streptomyces sp. NPDC085612 TaxID=3365732 RepID=UPI0037CEB1AC
MPGHSGRSYQADTLLDLREPVLDASVGQAAADAVGVLMRLSAAQRRRDRFLFGHGVGRSTPVDAGSLRFLYVGR